MTVYILVLFGLIIASCCEVFFANNKLNKILLCTSALSLVLLSGLRWTTGSDWWSYYNYFLHLNNSWGFEWGYVVFNETFRKISDNYTLFLLIDASVAVFFIVYVLYKIALFPNTSLLLFYCSYYLINYLGSNRRIIAMGFIFLAGYYIMNEKEKWKPFLCILAACLFHLSSIVFLLAFFIGRKKVKLGKILLFLVLSFFISYLNLVGLLIQKIASVLFSGRIEDKIIEYTLNSKTYNQSVLVNILGVVKRSFWVILLVFLRDRIYPHVEEKKFNYLFNMYFFSVCLYTIVNNSIDMLKVAGIYFSIYEIVLIPSIILIFKTYYERVFLNLVLTMYFCVQIYSALFLTSIADLYNPYLSVFSDDKRPISAFKNDD